MVSQAIASRRSQGVGLTRRWTALERIKPVHARYFQDMTRFQVVPAGRRSYKTEIGKRKLVLAAITTTDPSAWYVAAAPTHMQAKRIFWRDIKDLIPVEFVTSVSESELTITLVNGVRVSVLGMDQPARIEGSMLYGILMDEFGNMKPDAWQQNVAPALSDTSGFAWFIGVPEGRNHYYDLWMHARADDSGEWSTHSWHSSEVLPPEEIESARRRLDPLTFQQEYEASFISFTGRAYYTFDPNLHAARRVPYDPARDLIFCFDFNREPGVAAVLQEHKPVSDYPCATNTQTAAVGEVYIPRDSNTQRVCRKLVEDWKHHERDVFLYGDATGGAGGSAKVQGSDWDLVRAELRPVFGERLRDRTTRSNPPERVRVNSVNSRVKSASGDIGFLVDPVSCPHIVKDFEGVCIREGSAGEIMKKSNDALTHISDAIGYYIVEKWPLSAVATSYDILF